MSLSHTHIFPPSLTPTHSCHSLSFFLLISLSPFYILSLLLFLSVSLLFLSFCSSFSLKHTLYDTQTHILTVSSQTFRHTHFFSLSFFYTHTHTHLFPSHTLSFSPCPTPSFFLPLSQAEVCVRELRLFVFLVSKAYRKRHI
jgi:hypothetical protein